MDILPAVVTEIFCLAIGVGGSSLRGGGYLVMLPLAMVIIPDVVTQIICLGVRVTCLILLKWIFFRLS